MAFGLAASNDFVSVHREKMILIVRILTYCLTGLLLLNLVFNWFPGQEFRFGIAIPKLFFLILNTLPERKLFFSQSDYI